MTRFAQIVVTLIFALLPIEQAFGLAAANDLDLAGASITNFAQSDTLLFATADSPRGIYVSEDFGSSWTFATGGDYTSGPGLGVAVAAGKVFAVLNNSLFVSDATASPSWTEIDVGLSEGDPDSNSVRALIDPEQLFAITSDGTFIFVTSNYGKVRVVDGATAALLDTSTVVALTDPKELGSIAVDSSTSFAYVLVGTAGASSGMLFRSRYDDDDGSLTGWSEVTPSLLSTNTGRIGGVFTNQGGVLYVTTFSAGSDDQGIYRSTNDGSSYTRITPGLAGPASLNIRGAAFSGTTHFVGAYISFDSGATFADDYTGETSQGDVQNQRAILIDQNNSNRAIASADIGPIATSNLSQGPSSSWGQRFSGLRGTTIYGVDQSLNDDQIVYLALAGGIARTGNFTDDPDILATTPIVWSYPILTGDFANPAFSVKIDPDDDNIVYVGSGTLFRGVRDGGGTFTFSDLLGDDTPGKNIVDLSISGDGIVVASAQVSGAFDGSVRVLRRSDQQLLSTNLSGIPVTAVFAISEQIFYAGVGGAPSLEMGASDSANLGLYRSIDGGENWTKLDSNEDLNEVGVSDLEYDAQKDTLYVGALNPDGGSDDSDDSDSDDSDDLDDDDPIPTFYIVKNASSSSPTIKGGALGLPSQDVSALSYASKEGTRKLYAAVSGDIYESDSNGKTFSLFFDGNPREQINVLFFDPLLRASNAGFDGLSGLANLIVSNVFGKISGGSRKPIKVKFNRPIDTSRATKRKIRAKAGRGFRSSTRISKSGQSAVITPRGSWPAKGSVRVQVRSSLTTEGGDESIDTDYDGSQGGQNYRKRIKLRTK